MRSLQARLLIAVGLLAVLSEIGVALALRRDTRREFLRFQDVERRASFDGLPTIAREAATRLDGTCCSTHALERVRSIVPPRVLLFVFDASGSTLIARLGEDENAVRVDRAEVRDRVLSLDVTRLSGRQAELLRLQVTSTGQPIRLASGTAARLHLVPMPDPAREANADAFLDALDRRLLWLTGGVGLLALALTWMVARRTVKPLADLRDAAAALGAGAFEHRVRVTGPAEVAALAESFNALAARLQEQHALRQSLTNDVAHELRTPLTALRCRLESVIDGVASDPAHACRALREDVVHLGRLVDDLQDLALAEARELRLERGPVSMLGLVLDALQLSGLDDLSRVTLSVPEHLVVEADAARLRQVLVNLFGNVRRHAPPAALVRITSRVEGRDVMLEVENTGSDLSPAHVARLFDRFYRADPARQRETGGTGLGLAIVKHLVEAHGGRVWARSADGAFTVGLALPAVVRATPDGVR